MGLKRLQDIGNNCIEEVLSEVGLSKETVELLMEIEDQENLNMVLKPVLEGIINSEKKQPSKE